MIFTAFLQVSMAQSPPNFTQDSLEQQMAFVSSIQEISTELQTKMQGRSWHEGCPVPLSDLVLLEMSYWNEKQEVQMGQMIVVKTQAENVQAIFQDLYAQKYPIQSMKLMWEFEGDDDASMKANNTSAFNCRKVKGSSKYSQHSYGHAIDLNPFWNPWIRGEIVDPPEAKAFANREIEHPGVIKAGDPVVLAFKKAGWKWGGYWSKSKDYQHFSATGY